MEKEQHPRYRESTQAEACSISIRISPSSSSEAVRLDGMVLSTRSTRGVLGHCYLLRTLARDCRTEDTHTFRLVGSGVEVGPEGYNGALVRSTNLNGKVQLSVRIQHGFLIVSSGKNFCTRRNIHRSIAISRGGTNEGRTPAVSLDLSQDFIVANSSRTIQGRSRSCCPYSSRFCASSELRQAPNSEQ